MSLHADAQRDLGKSAHLDRNRYEDYDWLRSMGVSQERALEQTGLKLDTLESRDRRAAKKT